MMGRGTKESPYTQKDVLRRIRKNGGTAKDLDLSGKYFVNNIDLSCLDLKGINLMEANFEGANLVAARLEGADLLGVHLEGANLGDVHLEGADLTGAYLSGADLTQAHLQRATLADAYLEGAALGCANLEGAYLGGSRLDGAVLENVKFYHDTDLDGVNWGSYILGDEREGEQRKGDDRIMWFGFAATTYRRLKVWYMNAGISDIASIFYFREREAIRKTLKWRSRYWHHRLAMQGSYLVFGHGERWRRIFLWMALVVLGSAVAYYLCGGLNPLYSLYFSVVSFTALGYGMWVDIIPRGWVQALGATESLLGVFLMALLLVTLFRKWTR